MSLVWGRPLTPRRVRNDREQPPVRVRVYISGISLRVGRYGFARQSISTLVLFADSEAR